MSCKKPKAVRKDPLKTPKVWEKARREKMKIYFNELQEVLPFYDPSTPMSRFEILQKSKICIKDLQDQNQDLLNGGFDEVYRSKMTKLKQRVKELLKRVDQLTDLLRAANIMIPPIEMYNQENGMSNGNSLKWMNQRPRKWTEKINLVVPDDKIKSVLSLIKDYKKNSGKINHKRKGLVATGDKADGAAKTTEEPIKSIRKKKNKTNTHSKEEKTGSEICENNSSSGSQSPSQFKENQPVDYNSMPNNNNNTQTNNCNSTNSEAICENSSNNREGNDSNNVNTDQNTPVPAIRKNQNGSTVTTTDDVCAQILTLQGSATKVGLPQQLVEAPQNIVLPSPAPSVVQSNTFILTNDGSLVQLPILNSSGPVLNGNSNLLAPAATIIKPNAGLLTPIVINKPSPQVIVLQKPTTPIIQTAQILNATPQVISVPKSNVQILSSSIIYTSPNAISNPRTLPHIISKAPANKKRIMRDSTITTYVNKIPIAALSKHSYAKKTNVSSGAGRDKADAADGKTKEPAASQATGGKPTEGEVAAVSEGQNKEPAIEKAVEIPENNTNNVPAEEQNKSNLAEDVAEQEFVLETPVKRNLEVDKIEQNKKAKLKENLEENFFKPIENPMENSIEADTMFCNLALPSSINPSLSVSPTAAFLSSFPIVAPIRSEAEEEVTDKKADDPKESKSTGDHSQPDKMNVSKPDTSYSETNNSYQSDQSQKMTSECSVQYNGNDQQSKVNYTKNDYYRKEQRCKTVEKRTESKCYGQTKNTQNAYHGTTSNDNIFDYNSSIHNQTDKSSMSKPGPVYDQTSNFYGGTSVPFATGNDQNKINYPKNDFYTKDQQHQQCKNVEKRSDPKFYPKTPQNSYNIFDYNYSGSCYGDDDMNKYCNIQPYSGNKSKNKGVSGGGKKKSDLLSAGNEDPNKRTSDQIITNLDFNPVANQDCFSWMPGKNVDWLPGKSFGLEGNLMVPSTLPTLMGDLALGTTTTTTAANTNDSGLVKPGNPKICAQTNLKSLNNDLIKDYGELGLGNVTNPMGKSLDGLDTNKQYLEPFANLSKNIFDVTPSNFHNSQITKNDYLGNPVAMNNNNNNNANLNNNNNETIILKNIFELPVPKSTSSSSDFNNRHKQRSINNSQNTFLSVSQLVDLPQPFDNTTMKTADGVVEGSGTKGQAVGGVTCGQTYSNYPSQKQGFGSKNKSRSSHCKYNGNGNGERKYQGYKNVTGSGTGNGNSGSSYTAEALIRSNNSNPTTNITVDYPTNVEFSGVDLNPNYFNCKPSQSKPDQYSLCTELNKSDFQSTNQNIGFTDFNFSSPVPNFSIPSAASTDFPTHVTDVNGTNFNPQNNSYFTDFIPPEYPLSDNMSNSLLIPPCSISLQNPFVIDKRSFPVDKGKSNGKQCSTTKNRKHYECSKSGFNDFSAPGPIFTTASLSCSTIFTTSACHNLLPVPSQSIPISFSSPSFTNGNISFPPPLVTTSDNYHKFSPQSSSTAPSEPTFPSVNPVFPSSCSSKMDPPASSSSSSSSSVQNFISPSFSVSNVPFPSTSAQSAISFFSLSNPIVPSTLPVSSSNSLANFNLSTIFPEINQKGNYHYS